MNLTTAIIHAKAQRPQRNPNTNEDTCGDGQGRFGLTTVWFYFAFPASLRKNAFLRWTVKDCNGMKERQKTCLKKTAR
jgi:hypothetical protein